MKQQSITPKTEIIMGPLSRAEQNRYKALKEELSAVLDSINTGFIKAGRILGQIRDERLYRGEFDTFEQFCRSMVGKDKRYVHRIIQAHGSSRTCCLRESRRASFRTVNECAASWPITQ